MDGLYYKLRGVRAKPNAHPTGVVLQIVYTIRTHSPQLALEIMHVYRLGFALRSIRPTTVLIGPYQLFLLRINRNSGIVCFELSLGLCVDVFKLRIPIGVLRTFQRLTIRLKPVVQVLQQAAYGSITHRVAHAYQFHRQDPKAFARPAQHRLRIASRTRLDQRLQRDQ